MMKRKKLALLVSAYTGVRKLYELVNLLGIEAVIPRIEAINNYDELCGIDAIVVDMRPVIDVERVCSDRESKPAVIRIGSSEDPLAVLARIAKESGMRFGEIIVGIDPGPCPALAVVVDGRVVLGARLCKDIEDAIQVGCDILRLFNGVVDHAEVKVGFAPSTTTQPAVPRNCPGAVSFVDESSTSTTKAHVPGAPAAKRYRDVHAAVAIALRTTTVGEA